MKLFIGPASSGKSDRVLSRIAFVLGSSHARVLLITPSSNASGVISFRLQERIRESGIRPLRPLPVVVTFPALYTDILMAAGINLPVIENIERDRLLHRVIIELSQEERLDYFAETAESPGLAKALSGFIDELWRSGTDPGSFSQVVRNESAKDRDISLIFERYSKALELANSTDAEGAGLAAVRALEKISSDPIRLASISRQFSLIAADGFNFYTPVQVKLLSSLAALGVEVIATLTWQKDRTVHLWQQPTLARFYTAGADFIESSATTKGQIERAAALLMRDSVDDSNESAAQREHVDLSPGDGDEGETITVISAPDRAAEARAVAREIKSLILEKGFAPDSITIICRSISAYAHHLERIFGESAIPLRIDSPLVLSENPLIYALLKLLAISTDRFPRRAVLDMLRSPYFDKSEFGLDSQAVDLIDYVSMRSKVLRGEEEWIHAIRKTERDKSEADSDSLIDGDLSEEERREKHNRIAESLKTLFDAISFGRADTIRSYTDKVNHLIAKLHIADRARQSVWHERDHIALKAFIAVLENLQKDVTANAGDRIEYERFYQEIERSVASTTFERPAAKTVSVVVQEVHNLRPRRYRAVFALGLIEGEFPARITETSPYTLVERDALRRRGIDFAETTGDPGADLLQFYRVVASATEKLYLSYARADIAGGELLRSYLIDEMKSVSECREVRVNQSLTELDHSRIISREELALITARSMRDSILENGPDVLANAQTNEAVNLLSSELPGWSATVRGIKVEYERINRAEKGTFSGFFSDSHLLAELGQSLAPKYSWSASQINDYGVCPFRFFAKHLLKLGELREPSEGFVSSKLGTAYHTVLERVYMKIRDDEMQITIEDEDQCTALVEGIAESTLEEMSEKGEIRKGTFWEFEKREIKRQVTRLLLVESEWRRERPASPMRFEMDFGLRGTAPLVIKCEDGDVKLCGVIDRIDESEEGLVVIDYKLGRTPVHHRDALDGRNLQLPIYALAAERLIRNSSVASAYYLHIASRKKGSELPKGDDAALSVSGMISLAEDYIRDYVSRARRGRFPVSPNGNRCFPNCEYEVMCRIQSLSSSGDNGSDSLDDGA